MFVRRGIVLGASVPLILLLVLTVVLPGPPGSHAASVGGGLPPPAETVWTYWGPKQYALTDDGESLWIGGEGGVLQWVKATGETRRYGGLEGLRHIQIHAAAVDPAGNRWFGGDAGLSRLAPDGTWTHFDTNNSDLTVDYVDSIAVGADGAVWLRHGDYEERVSVRQPDGVMAWYPSRELAVVQAYDQVRQTTNANKLWAVSGDEIWLGYVVFDGANWDERIPPPRSGPPEMVVSDGDGNVYALAGTVFRWDGSDWSSYLEISNASVIGVGPGGEVWVGRYELRYRMPEEIFIGRLPDDPGGVFMEQSLGAIGSMTAIHVTADGPWAVGPGFDLPATSPGWIMQPDLQVRQLDDAPYVDHVVLAGEDLLFMYQTYDESGSLHALDDRGTSVLDDDVWHTFDFSDVRYAEPLPGGDLWVTAYRTSEEDGSRWGPWRYHDGSWIPYRLPVPDDDGSIMAPFIFAGSERVTWFTYHSTSRGEGGLLRLDDGGTPADLTDDVWSEHTGPLLPWALAVAPSGDVWAGSPQLGLWRYDGVIWEAYDRTTQNVEIAIAADGTVYAIDTLERVLIVRPDGTRDVRTIENLVPDEFERLVTSPHRSNLWTVAPDGALWFVPRDHYTCGYQLQRYDGVQFTTYDLPQCFGGGYLEIDQNHHVFHASRYDSLSRLSPLPAFGLEDQAWLLAPGSSRQRALAVHSVSGYSGTVTLALEDLPPGLSAAFDVNPVAASGTTQLTLTAEVSLAPGTYEATLVATDGAMTRSARHTIIVATYVYDVHMPFAMRP